MFSFGIIRGLPGRPTVVIRPVSCWLDTKGLSAGERLFLQTHVRVEIHVGCFRRFVPQPECYHRAIHTVVKKIHGGGVPPDMRGDLLPFERSLALSVWR